MKEEINISKIEQYLHGIIAGHVSSNTYVGQLPDTIKTSWNDMCLIDCGTKIRDLGCYGQGTVLVMLYAKPLSNGQKNVAVMNRLETALAEAIDNGSTDTYRISRASTYTDYDNDRKWHVNIVEIILKIY